MTFSCDESRDRPLNHARSLITGFLVHPKGSSFSRVSKDTYKYKAVTTISSTALAQHEV